MPADRGNGVAKRPRPADPRAALYSRTPRRGRRIKAQDVIITDCVGDDGKGLAFHRHGKRLIPASVINVVDEAQVLENSQGIRCTAQPECIKANRTGAGDSLDGIDAGLIPGTFLLVLRFILG